MLPAAGGPPLGKEETMHNFDRGKKARATRRAETLNKEPKDRSKSRPNPKAQYKRRKKQ